MNPELIVKSGDDAVLRTIFSYILGIECSPFFSNHIGKTPPDQKVIVRDFQRRTESVLSGAMPNVKWSMEHCPSQEYRDSIDIFGKEREYVVAIELDKPRADQVAKKFVSRMAILPPTTIYFISLCYPGTEKMDEAECEKYFRYCSTLARRMGIHYAGLMIR